jgi:hypothetical protein
VNLTAKFSKRRAVGSFLESAINKYRYWLCWRNVVTNARHFSNNVVGFENSLNFAHGSGNNKATTH